MKRVLTFILVILVLAFIAIQFVPVERTNPPEGASWQTHPMVIKAVLQRSCYDCHSNQTVWPWYSYVAPVSWLVAKDVREGREHLNFSEFASLSPERLSHTCEEIWDEVEEGGMPLPIYLKMHPQARLSKPDLDALKAWCDAKAEVESVGNAKTDEYAGGDEDQREPTESRKDDDKEPEHGD